MKVVRIIAPPFLTAIKSSELQGKLLICSNYAVWDLGLRQNHWVTHITFVDFNLDRVTSYSQLIHALLYFMNIMNLLINSWKVYDFLDAAASPVPSDDLTSDCIGGSQGRAGPGFIRTEGTVIHWMIGSFFSPRKLIFLSPHWAPPGWQSSRSPHILLFII